MLLAECDPAGGTLAARHGLAPQPGLVSLAAAARREQHPHLVADHVQQLPVGVSVLTAPPSGEQTRAALAMLPGLLPVLAGAGWDVLVDCGRLEAASSNAAVFAAADLALLVCRPQLPDLNAAAVWLDSRPELVTAPAGRLVVVLSGSGPYGPAEVAAALHVEVLAGLAWDPDGVAGLGVPAHRRAAAGALPRAVKHLVGEVVSRLPVRPVTPGALPVAAAMLGPAASAGPITTAAPIQDSARTAAPAAAPAPAAVRPVGVFAGQVPDGH